MGLILSDTEGSTTGTVSKSAPPPTESNASNDATRLEADFERRRTQGRPVPYSVLKAYRRVLEERNNKPSQTTR